MDKIISIEKERCGVLVRVYRDSLSSEALIKEEAHPVLCVIEKPEGGNRAAVKPEDGFEIAFGCEAETPRPEALPQLF